MEISKVKTANKMGSFVLRENHKKYKISFNFLDQITKETKNHRKGRVYFFVVNDKIKKIGGSSDRKGIAGTIRLYTDYGRAGSNRFALHYLIYEELMKQNKVEVWMTTSPLVQGKISGLSDIKDGEIAAYMEMEELCKSEYFNSEKKYPDWNFKENGQKTPKIQMQDYAKHISDYSDNYEDEDE